MRKGTPRVIIMRHVVALVVECWTFAEIGYYVTHDGETLHGAVFDMLHELAERLRYRQSVRDTLEMIHDLPEQE